MSVTGKTLVTSELPMKTYRVEMLFGNLTISTVIRATHYADQTGEGPQNRIFFQGDRLVARYPRKQITSCKEVKTDN
jgi:hypothetical protein